MNRLQLNRFFHRSAPVWLIGPSVLIFVVLTIYPMLYSVYLSLHNWRMGRDFSERVFVGLSNFINLFMDPNFWTVARNSLVYAFGVVFIELVLGLILALILNRSLAGFRFARSFILMPMIITPVVVALMWRMLFNNDLGMLNYFLRMLGLPTKAWLTDLNYVFPAVMLVDVWQWTPFTFLIFLAGLNSLPKDPYEVASVDGANAWQKFRYITLPLLQPSIMVAALIRLMDSFKIFDNIYILTFGGPGLSTEVLSLYAYRQGFVMSNVGVSAALSLILTVITIMSCSFLIRLLSRQH